jgi:hypothetical protein
MGVGVRRHRYLGSSAFRVDNAVPLLTQIFISESAL